MLTGHRLATAVALVVSLTAVAPTASARNGATSTTTIATPRGTRNDTTWSQSPAPGTPGEVTTAGPGVILWTRHVSGPIVMTTGLSIPGGVASGTSLNSPTEVALAPLESDGTPIWNSPGDDYRSAAAAHADVIAGADLVGDRVVVRKWTSASATPDWSYSIMNAGLASHRTVVVSDDGSTIAVLAQVLGGGATMFLFDAGSSTPIASYDATDDFAARNIMLTSDGRYAAFRVSAWAYVYDRDADSLRASFSTGAATDPIALSDDAQYIAYGFTNVIVQQWTGSSYSTLWTRTPPASILRHCAISADGTTVATSWSTFSATDPFVEIHDLASSTPNWTYDYPGSGGTLQDTPSAIDVTSDGGYIAVASWGNMENNSPQIHLFERASSTPLTTAITPGSMFDINVADTGSGVVYVAAGGKHVHANISGNSGDIYAIRYGEAGCAADIDGSGTVDFGDLLALLASWGPCPGCPEDTNGDGAVDFTDLLAVLAAWGPC